MATMEDKQKQLIVPEGQNMGRNKEKPQWSVPSGTEYDDNIS